MEVISRYMPIQMGAMAMRIRRRIARAWRDRPGARHRRLRARARKPLPSLIERYPRARIAVRHDLGLMTVPLEEILGTAVDGRPRRGGDFRPLRPMRNRNWQARWLSLRRAQEALVVLPPVELYRVGRGCWVVDGHNRVAIGLEVGQVAIDAIVTQLTWDGGPRDPSPGQPASMAAMLAESGDLRAAGQGRRSPTVSQPASESPMRGRHGIGL